MDDKEMKMRMLLDDIKFHAKAGIDCDLDPDRVRRIINYIRIAVDVLEKLDDERKIEALTKAYERTM